jgi:glycosyltransferase involved in cell wall biosynthesis
MPVERIAYVLNVFPKISETFIANELAQVLRRGIDLRVLSLRRPEAEVRHGIIERAGLDRYVSYDETSFKAELARLRPQIIHAHFALDATARARDLAADLGIPYSFTAHGYDIYRKPPADFEARGLSAGALVTVSEANAHYIAKSFGVPRNRMDIIPCGIDIERFSPDGEKAEPPHVICIARLRPIKNHSLLLEACAVLRDRGVNYRCVLLGDGPAGAPLQAECGRLGLGTVVHFAGAAEQDQVRDWLRRAALCVLSSDSEGMPVSLMEAAACGVPVVATAVGGVPEVVQHEKTGLLVPAGDASALAAALEQLLCDPARRERYGVAARQRALERFSVITQVDRLLAVWKRAIGEA